MRRSIVAAACTLLASASAAVACGRAMKHELSTDAGDRRAVASSTPEPSASAAGDASAGGAVNDTGSTPEGIMSAGPLASAASSGAAFGCNEQGAQAFLIRGNYIPVGLHPREHALALRYRAEQYGRVPSLTPPGAGSSRAEAEAVATRFMGLPLRVHRRIVPALACVESAIEAACPEPYRPVALGGIRFKNTYFGGEVTNHLFGIAVDVDPMRNPCCHCVEPWSSSPLCTKHASAPEERMTMPVCWVRQFERFGFYWLGHDVLGDTMHFEFLGDPARIDAAGPGAPSASGAASAAPAAPSP